MNCSNGLQVLAPSEPLLPMLRAYYFYKGRAGEPTAAKRAEANGNARWWQDEEVLHQLDITKCAPCLGTWYHVPAGC
jgi:hypothetical protein